MQAASVLFPPHSLRTLCMMASSSDFNTLLTENAGLSAFSEILSDEIVTDKVLGMDLSSGGHLTHGHQLNFSGRLYEFHSYGVDKETEQINYEELRRIALEVKPKLIVAGASAYAREIQIGRASCRERVCKQV